MTASRTVRVCRDAVVVLLAAAASFGCQDNETAIARGDRLWADSNYTGARAEYRLAAAQRQDEGALARLAHAQARVGDLVEARETYEELVEREPEAADQAISDYLMLARRALDRGDPYGMAAAVDAAIALRSELLVPEFELALARYHEDRGDVERALTHYRRGLLVTPTDSAPRLLYQMGLLRENSGDCNTAMGFYRGAREQARQAGSSESGGPWRSLMTESRWHVGNCAFTLAREARENGQVTTALRGLETVIELGEPANLLDQAWFDRGELLYGIGRFDDALASYRAVLERNPLRTGQLVERAQRRIDDIRFGVREDEEPAAEDTTSNGPAPPVEGEELG